MEVVNIQDKLVKALITVLFAVESFGTGLGVVRTHKYKTTTYFRKGISDHSGKSGQILSSLRIACASICGPSSFTGFALINIECNRFWCTGNVSSTVNNPKQICSMELELGKHFNTKDSQLDHKGKWKNLTSFEECDGKTRIKNITYTRTDGIETNDIMNRIKERDPQKDLASGISSPALDYKEGSTLLPNRRKPNT